VADFCHIKDITSVAAFIRLLEYADDAVCKLLYIEEFAQRQLFFRRVRVPTLLYVMWDRVLVNHVMRKSLRCLVKDGEKAIRQADEGMHAIEHMQHLASVHGLPDQGLALMYDTYEILAAAREYFFSECAPGIQMELQQLSTRYLHRYRENGYSLLVDFSPAALRRKHLRWGMALLLRDKQRYRLFDHVVTLRLLALLYPIIRAMRNHVVPTCAQHQAMGFDTVLR
jgi:hypothetical protein